MAIVSAVVVGGSVLAAGYFGFETLRDEFRARQVETRDAVVALKTETVKAVQTAQSETVEKLASLKGEAGSTAAIAAQGQISTDLVALKTIAETIRSEQKMISEKFTALAEHGIKAASAPGAMAMPPTHSALASSIYYPLAVAKGPQIDEQVRRIVPMLKEKTTGGACRVSVSGYSDTLGNDAKNLKLSQERADYVAAQLRMHGLTVKSVIGWGERQLKVYTMDATKNEQNRRVVVDMDCIPMAKRPAPPSS